ncbi:hypothetical protein R3P38DRAFT_3374594 [Favolaschia claudopus]|uniref:Uncharacterized protein n=1 Tax=Favolaschia claudopus TaxID=2862362 RepID=A0AAV9ZCU6_9AGAR
MAQARGRSPVHHTRAAVRDAQYWVLDFLQLAEFCAFWWSISPALLYSRVVSPKQVPDGSAVHASTPDAGESYIRSEGTVPLLHREVDFGTGEQDAEVDWTPVTKKTARSHRARTVSQRSFNSKASVETTTVEIATQDMSPENLMKLSRRYGQLASAGFRARADSQRKTVDPPDSDFPAKPGKPDAKKHLKELKQREKASSKPPKQSLNPKKGVSKAENAVRDSVVRNIHSEPHKNEDKKRSKSTAGRLPPGGFFEQVVRDTKRIGRHNSPPGDPPSSSSSSSTVSSDDEKSSSGEDDSEAAETDSDAEDSNDAHHKTPRMIIKPIPPTKYDGSPDTDRYLQFVHEASQWLKIGHSTFELGLWYAQQLAAACGEAVDESERLRAQLGDVYAAMAMLILRDTFGFELNVEVIELDDETYSVEYGPHSCPLAKERLKDHSFDLVAWARMNIVFESDDEFDFAEVSSPEMFSMDSESDGDVSPLELDSLSETDPDMPPLVSVSDSDTMFDASVDDEVLFNLLGMDIREEPINGGAEAASSTRRISGQRAQARHIQLGFEEAPSAVRGCWGFDNSLRLQDSSCADHRPLHKASGGPEDSWDGGHRLKELRRCWKDFRMDENITLHALPRSSSLSAFKILVQPVTLDVSSGSVLKLRKGYGDNYDNSVAHVGMLALEDFAAAFQQLKRGLDIHSGVVRVNTTRLLPSMEASHAPPERLFPSRMQSGLAFSGVSGAFPNKCSLRSFVNVRAYSNIAPAGDSSARWGASPRRAIVQSSLNHTTNVGRNRRSWAEACPPLPDSGDREETGAGASDSNTERRSRLLVAISSKVMQMGKGPLHLGMRGCEFGIQNFLSSSLSLGGEGYV